MSTKLKMLTENNKFEKIRPSDASLLYSGLCQVENTGYRNKLHDIVGTFVSSKKIDIIDLYRVVH